MHSVYKHPFAHDKTGEQVERYNQETLGFWATPSPVPHVFFAAWGSGRPGRLLQVVTAPTGEELLDYPYNDEPIVREKIRALAEF